MNDLQSLSDDELTRLYKSQSTESLKSLSDDDLVKAYRAEKGELPRSGGLDPVVPNAQNHLMQPEEKDDRGLMTRVLDAATDGFKKGFGEKEVYDKEPTRYFPATPQTTGLNLMANYAVDTGEGVLRSIMGLVRGGTHTVAQAAVELGMPENEAKRLERDLAGMVDTAAIMVGAPNAAISRAAYKLGEPSANAIMKTSKKAIELPGKAVPEGVKDSIKRPFQADDTVAADILNKALERAGKTPDDILSELEKGQDATKFIGDSKAVLPENLADLGGEATQSLLEQTIIAPGRARTIVKDRINDRQRGKVDPYSTEKLPSKVAHQQALFGQRERLLDDFARSLEIKDAGTALKTSKQIQMDLKKQAGPLYKKAYSQADDFDIRPALSKSLMEAEDMSGGLQKSIIRAVKLFQSTIDEKAPVNVRLKRFDYAKKALDDLISSKVRKGENEAVRSLTILRNDMLDAVHGGDRLKPTVNTYYSSARDMWAGGKQLQDAIDLGRNALKDGSEVSIEVIKGLSQGEKKMFRLGFYEAVKNTLGRKKATDDSTQIFRRSDFAEIHKAIAPHRKKKDAAVKPSDQFGELLNREHRMVETKNMLGNSRTAFRLEGQKDFDRLAAFSHRMRTNGLASAVIDTVSLELQQWFGMREAVSARLADLLTSTNPDHIRKAMGVIKRNYGKGGSDQSYSILVKALADNESGLRAGLIVNED